MLKRRRQPAIKGLDAPLWRRSPVSLSANANASPPPAHLLCWAAVQTLGG